ncbi:putative L-aspartate dehydrogenase [Spirochaetia bacterium]|nr:putative L-aspartate dehydrogenase [Spirochaetia bacterium]
MKKIGIIGFGNIGYGLAKAVLDGTVPNAEIVAVYEPNVLPAFEEFKSNAKNPVKFYTDFEEFLKTSMDIVVEAANPVVVKTLAKKILAAGFDFMMMSVGGLIENGFLAELEKLAEANDVVIIVPCGAITGQNIAAAGAIAGLDEVVIQSTKGIGGLKDAPYFKEKQMDISTLTEAQVVFRGDVFDAVKYFPQNVNVAASLALAGIGPEKTTVEIVADPHSSDIKQNVRITGKFGTMSCSLTLMPSPNKRSSYLAMLGAIAALKKYVSPIKIGY